MPFLKNFKRKAIGFASGALVAFSLNAKAANLPSTNSVVQKKPQVVAQVSKKKVEVNTNVVYRVDGKIVSSNHVVKPMSTKIPAANGTNLLDKVRSNAPKEVLALSSKNYAQVREYIRTNSAVLSRQYKLLSPAAQAHNKSILEPLARDYAKKYGVNPDVFVQFVQHESRWDPYAVGVTGDAGLTQLSHFIWDSKRASKYNCNPFNIRSNLRSSAMFLGDLQKKFGDRRLVLIAYNEGAPAVRAKLKSGMSIDEIVKANKNNYANKVLNEKI